MHVCIYIYIQMITDNILIIKKYHKDMIKKLRFGSDNNDNNQ
jgi:hypothetical protein